MLASRLGYRITALFVDRFLGRIFETPDAVFTEEMLRPEKQDIVQFAAGVDAIVEAQTRVALQYFEDGSVEAACPPLQALLHIMAHGSYEGKGVDDPEVRVLVHARIPAGERLVPRASARQTSARHRAVEAPSVLPWSDSRPAATCCAAWISMRRLAESRRQLARVSAPAYLKELAGTIGADPSVVLDSSFTGHVEKVPTEV